MKLRDLTAFILPRLRESSVCEACGAQFKCGASLAGCWCTEIELSESVRQMLRTKYRNCLCRACLERFAAAEVNSADG